MVEDQRSVVLKYESTAFDANNSDTTKWTWLWVNCLHCRKPRKHQRLSLELLWRATSGWCRHVFLIAMRTALLRKGDELQTLTLRKYSLIYDGCIEMKKFEWVNFGNKWRRKMKYARGWSVRQAFASGGLIFSFHSSLPSSSSSYIFLLVASTPNASHACTLSFGLLLPRLHQWK